MASHYIRAKRSTDVALDTLNKFPDGIIIIQPTRIILSWDTLMVSSDTDVRKWILAQRHAADPCYQGKNFAITVVLTLARYCIVQNQMYLHGNITII